MCNLHMPKTLQTCKKSMLCLIKKASRCAADCTSKTTTPFIFHFLYKTKIELENNVFHWFSNENCIISLFSLHKKQQTLKELKGDMNDETIVFMTSLLIVLT